MFSDFLNSIPMIILTLPAVLLSLSVHEAAHGYAAYKLGDPTARNLGRLTLNPLKHLHPIGFLSMLFFRVGWANPVPINTRYFKKPKRDMAISAAAGPLSNLCLGIIFTILLRLVLIPLQNISEGLYWVNNGRYYIDESLQSNTLFVLLSVLAIMLYLGISLNFNLMFFNLIPLPPLDGSRIATMFLPSDLYFKIMRYERYIMIAFIVLLATGIISVPLGFLTGGISDLLYAVTGMPEDLLTIVYSNILNNLPAFTL
jgi:Zn-dependent protease